MKNNDLNILMNIVKQQDSFKCFDMNYIEPLYKKNGGKEDLDELLLINFNLETFQYAIDDIENLKIYHKDSISELNDTIEYIKFNRKLSNLTDANELVSQPTMYGYVVDLIQELNKEGVTNE